MRISRVDSDAHLCVGRFKLQVVPPFISSRYPADGEIPDNCIREKIVRGPPKKKGGKKVIVLCRVGTTRCGPADGRRNSQNSLKRILEPNEWEMAVQWPNSIFNQAPGGFDWSAARRDGNRVRSRGPPSGPMSGGWGRSQRRWAESAAGWPTWCWMSVVRGFHSAIASGREVLVDLSSTPAGRATNPCSGETVSGVPVRVF